MMPNYMIYIYNDAKLYYYSEAASVNQTSIIIDAKLYYYFVTRHLYKYIAMV